MTRLPKNMPYPQNCQKLAFFAFFLHLLLFPHSEVQKNMKNEMQKFDAGTRNENYAILLIIMT
jgi:hypothetical protein